jgi:hypothetical protein
MADKTTKASEDSKTEKKKKPKRLSKGWRKHIRRQKQEARKAVPISQS